MIRRSLIAAIAGLAITTSMGCSEAEPENVELDETSRGSLQLVITVDWEGRDLTESNLAAMESLRERFPEVPLVHFLNAAYFAKPDANGDEVAQRIARPLRPDDELGLHIHGWKRLFEAADVTFRATPTFWGTDELTNDCDYDCGHEVPISAYEVSELRQVIRYSVDTLDAHGLGRATSFRAGGWMSDDNVRTALAAEGFTTENSAVPADFLASEIGHLPLYDWVDEMWRGTTETSQPYELRVENGPLLEIPDNGALADYVSANEMFGVYEECKGEWLDNQARDVVISIGFHQETADRFLPRIEQALERIFEDAEAEGVPIRVTTADAIARMH